MTQINNLIILTQSQIIKATEFANKIDTDFYATKNQKDKDKRINDQIVGKLGEEIAYCYLKNDYKVSCPDYEIYDKENKSWQPDLYTPDFKIHVKSQSADSSERFGLSWTFATTDKEVFKADSTDYVVFTQVNLLKRFGLVKSILKISTLHDNDLFKEPLLKKLVGHKKVIYINDIANMPFAL